MRRVAVLGAVLCAVAALSMPAHVAGGPRRAARAAASIERVVAHPVAPLLHEEARSRRSNPTPARHLGLIALLAAVALSRAVTARCSRPVPSGRLALTRVRGRAPPGWLVV